MSANRLTIEEKEQYARGNIKLVHHILKKYQNLPYDYDEKFSAGMLAMTKALNSFDPSKGVKLSSYLGMVINNELLLLNRKEKKRLSDVSLDEPLFVGKEGEEFTILDTLAVPESEVDWGSINQVVSDVLSKCSERDKSIFAMFVSGDTQRRIGEKVNLTQANIARIIKRILEAIKKEYWREPVFIKPKKEMGNMALTKEKLIQHLEAGKSTKEIAEIEGVSTASVYTAKSYHGLTGKKKNEKPAEKLEAVKQEVKQAAAENPAVEQELRELIARLEDEVGEHKINEVFLNNSINQLKEENEDYKQQKLKLQEEIENLKASAEDTEQEAHEATWKIKRLESDIAGLTSQLELEKEKNEYFKKEIEKANILRQALKAVL